MGDFEKALFRACVEDSEAKDLGVYFVGDVLENRRAGEEDDVGRNLIRDLFQDDDLLPFIFIYDDSSS